MMQIPQLWKMHNYQISQEITFQIATMAFLRNFNMKNIFELELCNFPNYVIIEKEF